MVGVDMQQDELELRVDGHEVTLSFMRRFGPRPTLLCLHGFGSTKEDYVDMTMRGEFASRDLVFWDAPGSGCSHVKNPSVLTIPFLVRVVDAAADALKLEKFHLLGHSMGGLTGLLFAKASSDRLLSFISVEGNLAPEDCFLSRQIIDHPASSPEAFMEGFMDRVKARQEFGLALYSKTLPIKVRPSTIEPVFRSMVDLSDNTDLVKILADLPFPRAFFYGAQNRYLSYLEALPSIGVQVVEIPDSGHFPMYSNPPVFWSEIAAFLKHVEE